MDAISIVYLTHDNVYLFSLLFNKLSIVQSIECYKLYILIGNYVWLGPDQEPKQVWNVGETMNRI